MIQIPGIRVFKAVFCFVTHQKFATFASRTALLCFTRPLQSAFGGTCNFGLTNGLENYARIMVTSSSKLPVFALLILLTITMLIVNSLVIIEHFSGESPCQRSACAYLQTAQLIAGNYLSAMWTAGNQLGLKLPVYTAENSYVVTVHWNSQHRAVLECCLSSV